MQSLVLACAMHTGVALRKRHAVSGADVAGLEQQKKGAQEIRCRCVPLGRFRYHPTPRDAMPGTDAAHGTIYARAMRCTVLALCMVLAACVRATRCAVLSQDVLLQGGGVGCMQGT